MYIEDIFVCNAHNSKQRYCCKNTEYGSYKIQAYIGWMILIFLFLYHPSHPIFRLKRLFFQKVITFHFCTAGYENPCS